MTQFADPAAEFGGPRTTVSVHFPTAEPPADTPDRRDPQLAQKLALTIVATVFCGLCLVGFIRVLWLRLDVVPTTLCLVYMVALLSLQLFYFSPQGLRRPRPLTIALLAVQAALVYLPLLQFHEAWVGMPGFLAGSVLLVLPFAVSVPLFALVVASMAFVQAAFSRDAMDVAYTATSTVISGLVVYSLSTLAAYVADAHAARTELARMAVAQERLRFARDLHDLIGYRLSAITLKCELTHRLIAGDPARAQEELQNIRDVIRKAQVDVRAVASGQRKLSLETEIKSVLATLTTADVDVRTDLDYLPLPARVGTLLATVLREGVTNILRHSKAETCSLAILGTDSIVSLALTNDGVREPGHETAGGNGIVNLTDRIAVFGGSLAAEPLGEDGFRLEVLIPLDSGSLDRSAGKAFP